MLSKRRSSLCAIPAIALVLLPAGCEKKNGSGGGTGGESTIGSSMKPFWSDDTEFAKLRIKDQNNLKVIGVEFHNYAFANQDRLPHAAIFDDKGKPLLSWRVAILPYIEQAELHKMFKLDESWDSEHNKALIPKMPKVYLLPGTTDESSGITHYRVFAGVPSVCREQVPMFDWPDAKIPTRPFQSKISQIMDGTSNTIMVAEAEQGVIWTKPDELICNPKEALPKLGYFWKGKSNVLMGDGSVRAISAKIDEQTLRILIGRQDGQVVDID